MYRVLVIVLLLHFVSGHFWGHHSHYSSDGSDSSESHSNEYGHWGPHHHPSHRHHHEDNDFDRLARSVISADKQLKSSCQQSPFIRTRLYQGVDFYALKYNLQEFTKSGVSVQFKHRVIQVTASSAGVQTFKDIRIVPDVVKTRDATWYFDAGVLTVLAPYKHPMKTEVSLSCGDVDEQVIQVPKATNSPNDLRFGNNQQ